MAQYFDLHLHLLPDVDDGPRSGEEAIELAQMIVDSGVIEVAVTPHFNAWDPKLLSTRRELEERVEALRQSLRSAGVPLEIHPGAEHFLTPELIKQTEAGDAPTLGPGPYMLVELPFDGRPLYADELLYELGLAGFEPVLAHPERYSWVQSDPDAVEPLVARGVTLQLTAASLSGHYGHRVRKAAEHLLDRGLYGLVGSDLHRPGQPRLLPDMAATVMRLAGIEAARVLFQDNPRRVLRGEALLAPPAHAGEPRKRRFGLFG
jgi:protein-tyrosine phosphatase